MKLSRLLVAWFPMAAIASASTTADVYVLAGQSNMDARAHQKDLPASYRQPQPDVRFYFRDRWDALAPGSSARPEPPNGFGPELSFGRVLADRTAARRTVALIKHTRGGTDLARDWHPDGGPQSVELLRKASAALAALRKEGYEPSVRAFIWMQGERDATTEADAVVYEENLRNFIVFIRRSFDRPALPFVIGRIQAPSKPFRDSVRHAQETVARSVPQVALVDTDDLTRLDGIHFDAVSLLELGRRFAAAAESLAPPAQGEGESP